MKFILIFCLMTSAALAGGKNRLFITKVHRGGTVTVNGQFPINWTNARVKGHLSCRQSGYRTYELNNRRVPKQVTFEKSVDAFPAYSRQKLTSKVVEACNQGKSTMMLRYFISARCRKYKGVITNSNRFKLLRKEEIIQTKLNCN